MTSWSEKDTAPQGWADWLAAILFVVVALALLTGTGWEAYDLVLRTIQASLMTLR